MNISAVIPLYNKEQYIHRAINSILIQNTPAEEIIVIDDGSTDQSANVVKNISDSRLRLIQQHNMGECAARNRGVTEAKNELIAFLDADDEWKPDFLTHIQELQKNFPDCGAYATGYDVMSTFGISSSSSLAGLPPAPWMGIIPNWFKVVQLSPPFFPSSIAIAKRVFQEVGGFPAGVKRGGDIMMWIRLSIHYSIAYSHSHQVIYHTEADNRACVIFPSEGESVCAKMMADMLENHEVPHDLMQDFKDYYARLQINKAKDMIKVGQSRSARMLLNKIRKNRRYYGERLKWQFVSYVPTSLIGAVMNIRALSKKSSSL